ncbi:MAG: RNA methyltransferase [Halofilum sp. (in: g-proteobacteria)]|nr:RNA methyltransferase [Halofilum sp. (in: g-proteobacteria)]
MTATIRIVLVETSHPGNIGAAARAMRVMGLDELVLVRPQRFPHADATAMAAHADCILERARVVDSLDEALTGCSVAFGTSARRRALEWTEHDARTAAEHVAGRGADDTVAFVFGRERTGLTNEELDRCHYMLHVPTAGDYGSLNLAQAVQIVAYELNMARGAAAVREPADPPPTHEDMVRFYAHLEQALEDIGFLDPDNPRQLMRRLRRYFNRSEPTGVELNILRGILRAAQDPKPGSATRRRLGASRSGGAGDTIPDRSDQE